MSMEVQRRCPLCLHFYVPAKLHALPFSKDEAIEQTTQSALGRYKGRKHSLLDLISIRVTSPEIYSSRTQHVSLRS